MASVAAPALTVPAPHRQAVDQFLSRLAAAPITATASVVAYGSGVRGGFIAGQSDLNLLVVVQAVTPEVLATVADAAAAGRKRGLRPVVLAQDELPVLATESPLVLWDIADRRLLLHGDDPLDDLEFTHAALWRQLTTELRDKLLGLRQLRLNGHAPKPPEAFSRRMLTSLLHLFRAALRLYGRPADQNRVAAIGDVARYLKLDLGTLQRWHAACYGDDPRLLRDVDRLLTDGHALLTAALVKLDALDPETLPLSLAAPATPARAATAADEPPAEATGDEPAEAEPAEQPGAAAPPAAATDDEPGEAEPPAEAVSAAAAPSDEPPAEAPAPAASDDDDADTPELVPDAGADGPEADDETVPAGSADDDETAHQPEPAGDDAAAASSEPSREDG